MPPYAYEVVDNAATSVALISLAPPCNSGLLARARQAVLTDGPRRPKGRCLAAFRGALQCSRSLTDDGSFPGATVSLSTNLWSLP